MGWVSDHLVSVVGAPLGAPLLPVELAISDQDHLAALLKYYSYLPIKVTKEYQFTAEREQIQVMSQLLPDYGVQVPSEYFYVGPLAFAPRLYTTAPRMNEFLLGVPYMFPNEQPDKQQYINTIWGENIGDVYYEEHPESDSINWVVGGSCVLSVTYGIGHKNIDKVLPRHIELLSCLVGEVYYKRLLAIRNTGKFDHADFSLDTSLLKEAYDTAVARAAEIIDSTGLVPVTIG